QHAPEVLPAWVADMDFLPAVPIRMTLAEAIEQGDLGYGQTGAHSGLPESFALWAQRRWQWRIDPQAVLVMPDVAGGLANTIDALTDPGDAVLVQTPIYPTFLSTVRASGRRLVASASVGPTIDFAALEAAIAEHKVRLILFCNPHNPTGRCFTRAELLQLAELAASHDLIVVSDEVHADLVYPGHMHTAFASLSPQCAARTVTLNSASKAFNLAGLRCAVCVAEAAGLRQRLRSLPAQRWTPFSTLGIRATLAAWSDEGEAWLTACVAQLLRARDHVVRRLAEESRIRCVAPQASYLAWLDCRELSLSSEPAEFFLQHARVALSPGVDFGEPGRGHARLNFATSNQILDQILDRIIGASP
ncbi:MAG: MalY/PatB family protein, partial [Steroidobacteraceae bacterium]